MSIETAQAVCEREVARHNAEPGRRGQVMNGRSYQAVFEAGLAKRVWQSGSNGHRPSGNSTCPG